MFGYALGLIGIALTAVLSALLVVMSVLNPWSMAGWVPLMALLYIRYRRHERRRRAQRKAAAVRRARIDASHAAFWTRWERYREVSVNEHIDRQIAAGRGVEKPREL